MLRTLRGAGVDFIVVGGIAAVLNGAAINTFDLDLVYARNEGNTEAILPVLDQVEAFFRMQPERRLKASASHLGSAGHLNLITRYGPLDLLGTIGRNLGYEELLPHSHEVEIGAGLSVLVLNLEKLIELKTELGGDKDRAVLPMLRQTLIMRQKTGDNAS